MCRSFHLFGIGARAKHWYQDGYLREAPGGPGGAALVDSRGDCRAVGVSRGAGAGRRGRRWPPAPQVVSANRRLGCPEPFGCPCRPARTRRSSSSETRRNRLLKIDPVDRRNIRGAVGGEQGVVALGPHVTGFGVGSAGMGTRRTLFAQVRRADQCAIDVNATAQRQGRLQPPTPDHPSFARDRHQTEKHNQVSLEILVTL